MGKHLHRSIPRSCRTQADRANFLQSTPSRSLPGAWRQLTSRFPASFLGLAMASLVGTLATAEEPVGKFLERLKEQQLHQLAAVYLEDLDRTGALPETMKADLPLERLLLLQDSLATLRSAEQRNQRMDQLKKGFEEFLQASPNHPRRSEARLALADLLLGRGQQALEAAKGPKATEQDRQASRQAFEAALKLFDDTLAELKPILESMQGARVAASDAAALATRERYQGEYRQAEILRGLTNKFLADTYPDGSSESKAFLEKSESLLSQVIEKTPGAKEAGRRTLSLLYRGQVQAKLSKVDDAYDSFVRVADIEETGPFREWRVQATASLVRLLANAEQGKFEAIIGRAEQLIKTAQGAERWQPEWLDLQLALGEAKGAWAAQLDAGPATATKARTEKAEARNLLNGILRRAGSHQEAARQALSKLGVEAAGQSTGDALVVKKFAEGLPAAREKIEQGENTDLSLEILRTRLSEASADEKGAIEQEIQGVLDASRQDFASAESILRQTLRLFGSEDARDDLVRARYMLSYALLKQDRFWESAVVSDFLTRSSQGSESGKASGKLALVAYQKLSEAVDPQRAASASAALESLANHMISTWPSATESQDAALILLDGAFKQQRWEDAERYLKMLPADGPKGAQIRRELGVVLYNLYLLECDARRKEGKEEGEAELAIRDRAQRMLEEGYQALTPDTLDQRAVETGNSLAAIAMKTQKLDEASAILQRPEVGPLAVLASRPDVVQEPRVKLDAYRLQLQTQVLAAGSGKGPQLDVKQLEALLGQMSKSVADTPEGSRKMAASLVMLAQDLRDQIRQNKSPQDRAKLVDSVQVLLVQLAGISEDPSTLDWAGSTMLSLAQQEESNPLAAAQKEKLFQGASTTYQRLLSLQQKDPKLLESVGKSLDEVEWKSAMAMRGAKQFPEAIERLKGLLKRNNQMLSAQLEAARALEDWGTASKNPERLREAMLGTDKLPNGTMSVWGWGLMSQKLARSAGQKPELLEYFFESRMRLAQCRMQIAASETDPAKKTKEWERTLGDLRSTAVGFPGVVQSKHYPAFDQIAREAQRALNKPQSGMKDFLQATPANP